MNIFEFWKNDRYYFAKFQTGSGIAHSKKNLKADNNYVLLEPYPESSKSLKLKIKFLVIFNFFFFLNK